MAINVAEMQAIIDTQNTLHGVGAQWHEVTCWAKVSRLEADGGTVSHWRALITVKFTGETYESIHNFVRLINAYAYLRDIDHVSRLDCTTGELAESLMARGTFTIDTDGLVHFHL